MEGWREQTTEDFKLRMLPGNHFFLHESQDVLLQILFRELHSIRNKQLGH
jgi:medium-chain acyl-[acyl-carrier-protein] hydrolase